MSITHVFGLNFFSRCLKCRYKLSVSCVCLSFKVWICSDTRFLRANSSVSLCYMPDLEADPRCTEASSAVSWYGPSLAHARRLATTVDWAADIRHWRRLRHRRNSRGCAPRRAPSQLSLKLTIQHPFGPSASLSCLPSAYTWFMCTN